MLGLNEEQVGYQKPRTGMQTEPKAGRWNERDGGRRLSVLAGYDFGLLNIEDLALPGS